MLGNRLKRCREEAGLSQEKLASMVNVSRKTIIRWEAGERAPSSDKTPSLSKALGVSVAYLMGETDDPTPAVSKPQKKPSPMGPDLKHNIISMDNWVPIPVLDMNTAACAGAGNGLCGVIPEASEYILVDPEDVGPIDELHRPFCIRVEGDSMEGAGIPDKSKVIINPAVEVFNGRAALVVYNDTWAVKWVLWRKDGGIELRSANPNYSPIVIDPEVASDESWFRVIGPVMAIPRIDKPKALF